MARRSRENDDIRDVTPSHLASLEIRDFKSLKLVHVDLGQVNVFIGPNGAGKSNLLESIGLLGAAVFGRIDDQSLLRRGVRPGVPALYKSSFKNTSTANFISLESQGTNGELYRATMTNPIHQPQPWWALMHETLTIDGQWVASRSPNGKASVLDLALKLTNDTSVASLARANQKTPEALRTFLNNLEDFAIFSPVTPVLRGIAQDTAPRNPVGLFGGQLPEALALLLSSARPEVIQTIEEALSLIDWAQEFSVNEPSREFMSPSVPTLRYVLRFTDRFMARGRNLLSAYDASEGALYALFMLVLAVHGQSPWMFAVDNFDQALNPRTARALTRTFVEQVLKNGRQVFLTTHGPLVLDGLPLEDDRVRLFTVSRHPRNGQTIVNRVTVDLIKAKKKLGELALSQLWVMGRLGGIPDV